MFVDPDGTFATHYVDKEYNILLQTNDGSDDVVMVPDAWTSSFNKFASLYSSANRSEVFNSSGWNNHWKQEFGLADVQFSAEALGALDHFNTIWSRNAAAAYLLKPSLGNAVRMGFSEGVSQWTNPELVVAGMSAGITGFLNFKRNITPLSKLPVGRSGNIMYNWGKGRNVEAVIGNTKFSGHALDQMQNRGIISPTAVIDVINNPTEIIKGNKPHTLRYIKDNLKVIVNQKGDIITVMWH